jgi:hypothetical protein
LVPLPQSAQTSHALHAWHVQVNQRQVGIALRGQPQQAVEIAGLTHLHDVGKLLHGTGQGIAHQRMVIGDQHVHAGSCTAPAT